LVQFVPRWAAPVYRLIAGAAGPCGVPAAMTEAGLVTDEHRTGSVAW
jgi:hypothetical protein